MDNKGIGSMSFEELAPVYLASVAKIRRHNEILAAMQEDLHGVEREIMDRLSRSHVNARACGSSGVAVASGHAWWVNRGEIEVQPIAEVKD